jgi:hypothetical protein
MTQRNTDEKTSEGVGRRFIEFQSVSICAICGWFSSSSSRFSAAREGRREGIHPQIAPILAEENPGDPTRDPTVNRSRRASE